MGVAVLFLALAFPGNGYHCFGSPGATGEILPVQGHPYVVGISVVVARPNDDPVAWIYASSNGKNYLQVGKNGGIKPFPGRDGNQIGWKRFRCTFPLRYSSMTE
jgi:hypothetical protein